MDNQKCRSFGAALVLLQGAITAFFPKAGVGLTKRMIGKNFDNASDLKAPPAYLRQLRAIGVGMVAAGGTSLLLDGAEESRRGSPAADELDGAVAKSNDWRRQSQQPLCRRIPPRRASQTSRTERGCSYLRGLLFVLNGRTSATGVAYRTDEAGSGCPSPLVPEKRVRDTAQPGGDE